MGWCCVDSCPNRTSRKSSQQKQKENEAGRRIKFFGFPSDAIRKAKWVHALQWVNKEPGWAPSKNACICSEHFTDDNLRIHNRKVLTTKDAYPSIFKPPSTTKPKEPVEEKLHKHRPIILGAKRKASSSFPSKDIVTKRSKVTFIDCVQVEPKIHKVHAANLLTSSSISAINLFTPCTALRLDKSVPQHDVPVTMSPDFNVQASKVNNSNLVSSAVPALNASPTALSPPTFEGALTSTPQNVSVHSTLGGKFDAGATLSKSLLQLNVRRPTPNFSSVLTSPLRAANTTSIFQDVSESSTNYSSSSSTFDRASTHSSPEYQSSLLTEDNDYLNFETPRKVSPTIHSPSNFIFDRTSSHSLLEFESSCLPEQNNCLNFDTPQRVSSSIHSLSSSTFDRASSHSSFEIQSGSSTQDNDFFDFDTPRKVKLKKELSKQAERIEGLKKKLKLVNQSRRRDQIKIKSKQAERIEGLKKKLKLVNQSRRRDQIKIKNMELVIENLKKEALISEEEMKCIKDLGQSTEALIIRQIQKARGMKVAREYEPVLRAFACTLHYYSPRAYNFVRDKCNKSLPHSKTIARWYMGIDGKPGFTPESLTALAAKVKASKYPLYAALSIDEVSIRQKVEKNFTGYVDLGEGTGVKSKDREIASQALVFMLVGINGAWKIPIGYFLIKSLKNDEKAALVTKSLSITHKTGIRVKSLTFDGTAVNFATVKRLGCNFTLDNMITWFPHPENANEKIHVFLDPSHMLKLVRNTLGEWFRFYDSSGGKILWQYLVELHKLQEVEGLRLANKLSSEHIHFHRKKMNVRLAAQLISSSAAKSLKVCTDLRLEEFEGCEPLQKFLENFDKLFDILNSKSLYGTGFKKALNRDNKDEIFAFFTEMTEYIKGLYLDAADPKNSTLLSSDRYTGFLGFLICMKSTQGLYEDLCEQEDSTLHYLPLYKISQDHLELFFGLIRARGGWNNNPSALHFQGSYKRCLVHLELRSQRSGNCFPLENITILYCTKAASNPDKLINLSAKSSGDDVMAQDVPEEVRFKTFDLDKAVFDHFNALNDHLYVLDPTKLSSFARNVVTYIAGFVVKTLKKSLKCKTCVLALTHQPVAEHRLLLDAKDRGGLIVPGQDVVEIAESCEQIVRTVIHQYDNNLISKNNNTLKLTNDLMALYALPENNKKVFNQLDEHVLEQDPLSNHKYLLIRSIAIRYFNTRLNHIVRQMVNKVDSVRHYYNKLVLFNGQ